MQAEGEEVETVSTISSSRSRHSSTTAKGAQLLMECCDTKFEEEILYATHKEGVHGEPAYSTNRFIVCCNEKITGTLKFHLKASHKLDEATGESTCCDSQFRGLEELAKHCSTEHGLKLSAFKRMVCCATKIDTLKDYMKHKGDDGHVECNQCTYISKVNSVQTYPSLRVLEVLNAFTFFS